MSRIKVYPSRKALGLRLPPDMHAKVIKRATASRVSVNKWLETVIAEKLGREAKR